MDRYDTASQRPPEDVRIAPFGHLSSQGFAGRELSDRLRQVAVRTAAAAEELPDPRQQVVEIEPVEVSQHPGGRGRELQDADRSSRAEDAADLVQPLLQAPKVAQAEADEDVFECPVGERQAQSVGQQATGSGRGALRLSVGSGLKARELPFGSRQHLLREIAADDPRPGTHGLDRQITRSPAKIEDEVPRRRGQAPDRSASPRTVQPGAEKVVEEVVTVGDRREHLANGVGIPHGVAV